MKAMPQCKVHGYEFRIVCDECQIKYAKIMSKIAKQMQSLRKKDEKFNR